MKELYHEYYQILNDYYSWDKKTQLKRGSSNLKIALIAKYGILVLRIKLKELIVEEKVKKDLLSSYTVKPALTTSTRPARNNLKPSNKPVNHHFGVH